MSQFKRRRGTTKSFTIRFGGKSSEWYHDPILENPLDDEMEGLITIVGAKRYLKALIEKFRIECDNADLLTEQECRKVIRGIMRHAEDYNGPEMKQ